MAEPIVQESYIVNEGKKRGSTRDVRPEALHDRFYTVLRVHAGDALLTDNWHTTEVLEHARNNFAGRSDAVGEMLLRDGRDRIEAVRVDRGVKQLADDALAHRCEGTVRHVFHRKLGDPAELGEQSDADASIALGGLPPQIRPELVVDGVQQRIGSSSVSGVGRKERAGNTSKLAGTQISLGDGPAVGDRPHDPEKSGRNETNGGVRDPARDSVAGNRPSGHIEPHGACDEGGDGLIGESCQEARLDRAL